MLPDLEPAEILAESGLRLETLIVCVSEHHGNTKKIADAMAAVLDAEVRHPDDVNAEALAAMTLNIEHFRRFP